VGGLCNGVGYKGNGPVVGLVRRAAWSRRAWTWSTSRVGPRTPALSQVSFIYLTCITLGTIIEWCALYSTLLR
jgi:hypothetical protein